MAVDELPKTLAPITYNGGSDVTISATSSGVNVLNITSWAWSKNDASESGGNIFASFGGDKPHVNIPPGKAGYMWQRVS